MKCENCGKMNWNDLKNCKFCGYRLKNNNKFLNFVKTHKSMFILFIIIFIIFGIFFIGESEKKLPIKVNISMTSNEGVIDYILLELGLDFDLVTGGANCYTGIQKNEFKTEKYGILHTEFRYCKSTNTQIFKVYNDETEQKLREPEEGELKKFDSKGIPLDMNIEDYNIFNKTKYGVNETFEFDNLEIIIGENYSFTYVDNKYSDYYKKTILKIPITVKNIDSEINELNMFYYDVYGSLGTELEKVNTYFDDTIDYAGGLKQNASYTKYIYVLYDGDGAYSIEFNNFDEKITVEFNVNK